MRWAMLALCACASQRSAESHADYVANTETTKTEGAERVTVLEFAPPDYAPEAPRVDASNAPHTPSMGSVPTMDSAANSLPPHGPLLKATVIERAPVVTETHSGLDVKTDAESASSHSWFHLGFLAWAGIAAGAVAAGLLAWKFRSGLASGVLRVLGRG